MRFGIEWNEMNLLFSGLMKEIIIIILVHIYQLNSDNQIRNQ